MTNEGDVGPGIGTARIPSLDGLRAISIALVLMGHAIPEGPHSFAFTALFLHSDLGVRVFFVISGFLITRLLLDERFRSGNISLRLFYIRRALRILPAFFLYIGCVALLSLPGIAPVPLRLWLYVLTYMVNNAPHPVWVIGHLWSLSVEEQFYMVWPMVVKIARPRMCAAAAILAIFANPAARAVHALGGPQLPIYATPLVCGPIAMGCLLAMWSGKVRSLIVLSKLLSDGRSLLCALILIGLFDAVPNHFGAPTVFLGIITNSLLTLCVARFVFIPGGMTGRILNSSPFVLVGKLSYSLYLWQQLFLRPDGIAPVPLPIPLSLVATFAAASACYVGVEARFMGLRRRFRNREQSAAVLS